MTPLAPTEKNGRVAAVIPTYNRAALLPRAIDSARVQTARDRLDIIVVDDGSSDDTADVVRRLGDDVRYIYQPNAGAAAARNAGVRATRNEFVAFLDSDDQWAPCKIERQLAAMQRWPQLIFATGRSQAAYADGRSHLHHCPPIAMDEPTDFAPLLFDENFLPTPTMLIRRVALEMVGLFDETLAQSEDYHLWTRLASLGMGVYLDDVLCTYHRDVAEQLTSDLSQALGHELRSRRRLRDALRRRPDCRPIWRRALGRRIAVMRDRHFRQGLYWQAALYGAWSLWQCPLGRPRWEWMKAAEALLCAARRLGPPAASAAAPK